MRSEVVKFKTHGGTTYDSVNDWGFRLLHCDEQKPSPKFERVDIPGANGSIDLSTALSNDIPFEDRIVELTFFKLCSDHDAAYSLVGTVAEKIHGKQLMIQTPDSYTDGGTWYTGDVEITSCIFEDRGCEINVKCTCDPFRVSSTGGTQALTASTKSVVTSGNRIGVVSPGDLDSNGLQFRFAYASGGYIAHNAVAATFARGDNLFDVNLTNVRFKACKTGESWQNSIVMRQSGQEIEYGETSNQWVERVVFTATSATSGIRYPRFAFTGNTHAYVFVESDTVTAMSNVTYDGYSYSAGIRVNEAYGVRGSIGSNGIADNGIFGTMATYTPTLNQSISTIIDCGTVNTNFSQLYVDVIGLTCTSLNVKVMFVIDGGSAPTVYEEPSIEQIKVSVPHSLNSSADTYTSMMPHAWVTDNGVDYDAPTIENWPRDAVYIDFAAVDASGWLQDYPAYYVEINNWPEKTVTISNGSMPTYPTATTDANGAVIEYNSNINIVSPNATDAELPTLLNAGSNTITYTLPGSNSASATLNWAKGVL